MSKRRALYRLFPTRANSLATMALWKAASLQDTEGVARALEQGAEVNAWNDDGDTALHTAAFANNTDMIDVLTQAKDVNIDKGDDFGRTPLYVAVEVRAKEAANALLVAGADPNEGNIFAKSPLHVAAFSGRLDMAKILLQFDADVNCRDHSGYQPLTVAFLLSPNPSMARLLLRYGANINATDHMGQGLLLQAVYNCKSRSNRDAIAFLLRHGADVNLSDEMSEWTPLHAAAFVNDDTLVRMLVDAGADPLARDASGMLPMQIALLAGNMEAAGELRKHYPPDIDFTVRLRHGLQYRSPNFMLM